MDTPGNVIDKLMTVNLKIYYNLCSKDRDKLCDLNLQRLSLQDEVSLLVDKIAKNQLKAIDISRPQHKTY